MEEETVVCCREESKSQPYEWGHHQWLSCWFSGKAHIAPLPHSHWLANNTPKPITGIAMKNLLPKSSNSPKSQRLPPKCVKCGQYFKGEALQWIRLLKNSDSTKSANFSREDFFRERGYLPNLFGGEMQCYTKFIRKQKTMASYREEHLEQDWWVGREKREEMGGTNIHTCCFFSKNGWILIAWRCCSHTLSMETAHDECYHIIQCYQHW